MRARARELAPVVTLVALAFCLYPPWEPTRFPVHDDPYLFVVLQRYGSAWEQYAGLTRWLVGDHGRFDPIGNLMYVGSFAVFGRDAIGWQVGRFCLMVALASVAYLLLRRLGAAVVASAAGAALFVCANAAPTSWSQHALGEPLGMMFVLCATWIAARFQDDPHPGRAALLIAAAVMAAALVKETLVSVVPFLILLGVCRTPGGAFALPSWTRRNVALVAALAATGVVLVGVFAVVKSATPGGATGSASNYSLSNVTLGHSVTVLRLMLLPVTRLLLFPANLLYFAAIGAGVALYARRASPQSAALYVITALSLPLGGILIYLPWKYTLGYYGFPYMLGGAMLFARALTELQHAGRWSRYAAYGVVIVVLAYGSLFARNIAAAIRASAYVDGRVAEVLAAMPAPTALAVASPSGAATGLARDLKNLALAYGADRLQAAEDVTCPGAAGLVRGEAPRSAIVVFSRECPTFDTTGARPFVLVQRAYVERDWKTLRAHANRVDGRIWPPSGVGAEARAVRRLRRTSSAAPVAATSSSAPLAGPGGERGHDRTGLARGGTSE